MQKHIIKPTDKKAYSKEIIKMELTNEISQDIGNNQSDGLAAKKPVKKSKKRLLILLAAFIAIFIIITALSAYLAFGQPNPTSPETKPVAVTGNVNKQLPIVDTASSEEALPSAWEIKTGSWGQSTNGKNPSDESWRRQTVTSDSTLFFTHSAAVARARGNVAWTNSPDKWPDAASNIKVEMNVKVYDITADPNNTEPLSEALAIEALGGNPDYAKCNPAAAPDWWGEKGWQIDQSKNPNSLAAALGNFSKDDNIHYGLRANNPKERNQYSCRFTPKVPSKLPVSSKLKFVSTVKITPSGAGGSAPDQTTSSAEIIWSEAPIWNVVAKSYAMVNHLSGVKTSSCSGRGQYCLGQSDLTDQNIAPETATIYLAADPAATDGGSFDLNFKHTVETGSQNTGNDLSSSQLWFYKIQSGASENYSTVNLLGLGCLSHKGFGADAAATASFQNQSGAMQQWNPIVLEAGKTYDILSRAKTEISDIGAQGQTLCSGGNIQKPANQKIKTAAFYSTVHLCFANESSYKYRYGDSIANDYAAAKAACETALLNHNDTIVTSSTSTILFKK
jgi:hypothetical protein